MCYPFNTMIANLKQLGNKNKGSLYPLRANGLGGSSTTPLFSFLKIPAAALAKRANKQKSKKEGGLGEGIFARLLCRAKRGMGWEAARPARCGASRWAGLFKIRLRILFKESSNLVQKAPPNKKTLQLFCRVFYLAEGAGFEPAVRLHVRSLSKRVPSTAQPPFLLFFSFFLFLFLNRFIHQKRNQCKNNRNIQNVFCYNNQKIIPGKQSIQKQKSNSQRL